MATSAKANAMRFMLTPVGGSRVPEDGGNLPAGPVESRGGILMPAMRPFDRRTFLSWLAALPAWRGWGRARAQQPTIEARPTALYQQPGDRDAHEVSAAVG